MEITQSKEDKYGESFDYKGEVYVKCYDETQLKNILEKWCYGTIEEFEKETGCPRKELLGKFFMACGAKDFRVYILEDGLDVEYSDRKFQDHATGEIYTGEEILELNMADSIWMINEFDLTKDLMLGEEAHTRIKPEFYDRENHITDFVDIQRVE